jgi:pyridoxine 4-dehydrogenase
MSARAPRADAAGGLTLGDELPVRRLGFGAMRITGEGVWSEPPDRDGALAVLRRAVELGINLIDTADSYGPEVSEQLIAEALKPYPEGLVIATKGGFERDGPGQWRANCRPEHLKQACEGSLRRLRLERIDLYQLHTVDREVPFEDSLGALIELHDEGKIAHIGLSNVDVEQLETGLDMTPIVSVQDRYSLVDRDTEEVLDACTRRGLGFIPWFPLDTGSLARSGGPLGAIAARRGATAAQVALAWLLARSPVMLPIPGTSSVEHLEENVAAASIQLSDEEVAELAAAVRGSG